MNNPILLCTVGGSHQPIIEAIRSTSPCYVCFFCTDRDPTTNRPGSIEQVTGKGNVIKASYSDPKPTLPNIPAQADLNNDQFEVRTISADDLDDAYSVMRDATAELAAKFSGARFIADYTGGTKTMTAALVCAALERDDVELQLVAGARTNLDRVQDGTEQAMTASVARLRLRRAMTPYLGAWERFAYHEASEGLNSIRVVADATDRQHLQIAKGLSRALAFWDHFDHVGAFELIKVYSTHVNECFPNMFQTLSVLTKANDKRREPALLFDLWLNAERRAAQGRFDDAIARWYRLMEWTVQWQLRTKLNADTADFPRDLLPKDADATPGRDGKIKIGLWQAWQVVGDRLPGSAQDFVKKHGNEILHLVQLRNASILAHGFRPVSGSDWQEVCEWTHEKFLPVLRAMASEVGLKSEPQQLPKEFPESLTFK